MRVLELFSGTRIFSETAHARGHDTFTIDLHEEADLQADILQLTASDILNATGWGGEDGWIDLLWASPVCTGFSVAAIGRSWRKNGDVYTPISDAAKLSLALLEKTFELIEELQPRYWFVENPRGMARKMSVVQPYQRHTVTYCQYGENRMKPTDIWTNSDRWIPRPACRNGDPCHEAAPRGSRSGTQGIRDPLLRARLPEELCEEVIDVHEWGD